MQVYAPLNPAKPCACIDWRGLPVVDVESQPIGTPSLRTVQSIVDQLEHECCRPVLPATEGATAVCWV